MNYSQSSKGEIFRGMMRNPDTARLIKEAMASGLGSTPRKKLQKTFSIMGKLNNSYDGAGGPGMMADQMSYGQMSQQDTGPITISNEGSRSMVIFHRIPKPKIIYGKKVTPQPKAFDGSGGPGNALDGLGRLGSLFATPFTNTQPPTWEQQRDALRAQGARQAAEKKAAEERAAMFPQTKINTGVFTPRPPLPPEPSPWQPGIIPRAGGWLANRALPAIGSAIGTAGMTGISALGGLAQFAKQNLAELPFAAWRGLVGKDTSLKDQPGPGWLPLSQTKGLQELARMFPGKPGASTAPVASGALPMTDAQRTALRAQGAASPQTAITTSSGIKTGQTDWSSIMGGPKSQGAAPGVISTISSGLSSLGSAGGDAVTQSGLPSSVQVGTTAPNIAASNIASFLKVPVTTNPFTSVQMADLMKAIATNEGFFSGASAVAANNNNPGNLKYAGQAGATQGGQATDGGNFAKFATMNDGWEALKNDLEAKKNSGKYTTIEGLMSVYSPNSGAPSGGTPPGGPEGPGPVLTGDAAIASDYIKRNVGAGQFVLDTMAKEGGSLNARAAANKKSVWDEYDIDKLRDKELLLKNEVRDLPKDQADYIRARDQYLVQTDKAIADYLDYMQQNNDMSDPAAKQQMNSHLNYLYTLRGRQNKTYVGYLNEAVSNHQNNLKNTEDTLTKRLAEAEASLASKNAITQDEYNMRAAALNDMYTTLKNAPTEVYQMRILKSQAIQAEALAALDPAKKGVQTDFITQGDKLENYIWDSKHLAIPGIDLVDQINTLGQLAPDYLAANIYTAYKQGVYNYLNAPNEKDETTGTGITDVTKDKMAAEAIRNFARVSIYGAQTGDANAVELGALHAAGVGKIYADRIASKIEGKSLQLMEAVKELSPKGWFGGAKTPPTLERFTEIVKDKTGGDSLSDSIAKAVYSMFLRFSTVDGGTPVAAVDSLLYSGNSTEERAAHQLLSSQEFAQNLGQIYILDILTSEFAQNEQASIAMENLLYPTT